jgi:hypothetical protein
MDGPDSRVLTCGNGIGFSGTLFTPSDEADTVSTAAALTVTRTHRRRPAMIKKVLTWLGIAFLIFFIAFNPNSAASVFESLGGTIADIARGFGTFFTNLVA